MKPLQELKNKELLSILGELEEMIHVQNVFSLADLKLYDQVWDEMNRREL